MRPGRYEDERRSARLLFAPELAAGTLDPAALDRPDVRAALTSKPIPSRPARAYQRHLLKTGAIGYERTTVPALTAAREAVLGDAAAGPPRPLIRVDGFPPAESLRQLHAVFAEAGVSYLLTVEVAGRSGAPASPPRTGGSAPSPLDAAERDLIAEANRAGVSFGLGGLDAWAGLDADALGDAVDRALAELLDAVAIRPRVLVPPSDRLDAKRWATLAQRFDVIGGGPESSARMGYHDTPLARHGAVYLPAYPPLHGPAAEAAAALTRLRERETALWTPIAVDAGREASDGWAGLRALAAAATGLETSWDALLDASVAAERDA